MWKKCEALYTEPLDVQSELFEGTSQSLEALSESSQGSSQSLESNRLETQSSGESAGPSQPAGPSPSQPLRRGKSAAHYLRQTVSNITIEVQKLYQTVIDSASGQWIDNCRVFTEGSPEVIELRKKEGLRFPKGTSLCIHVERTAEGVLKFTTLATRTPRNKHNRIITYIEKHFCVDDMPVKKVDMALQDDHVWPTKASGLGNLRSWNKVYDVSLTIKLPHELHTLRTNYFEKVKPKANLENLTQSLWEVMKSLAETDKAIWSDKAHRKKIFTHKVTQKFLQDQYAGAHRFEVSRMAWDCQNKGYTTRQSTAYTMDEGVREGLEHSASDYIECQVAIPRLNIETVAGQLESRLSPYQREGAENCYRERVRLDNLPGLSKFFSQCIGLTEDLVTYASSPAGEADGCTEAQIARHKDTQMYAERLFDQTLKHVYHGSLTDKSVSQEDLDQQVLIMRSETNVNEKGNPIDVPLTTEAVKARIKTRAQELHMDSLYIRDNVYTIQKPSTTQSKRWYGECVKRQVTEAQRTLDYGRGRTI